jgi:hypothetical protein
VDVQDSTLRKIIQVELGGRTAGLHQPGHILYTEFVLSEFLIEPAEVFLLHPGKVFTADAFLRPVAELLGAVRPITCF